MRIPLHPANLGQLLEDTTLLLVFKELLELTLFVAKTLDARRHPRWRHGEQNVGAIHPVDMRHHRVKSTRGDILEAQVLLDCQPFPLSLQAQCSRGQLHWPFVNLDAKIPPDVNVLIFS